MSGVCIDQFLHSGMVIIPFADHVHVAMHSSNPSTEKQRVQCSSTQDHLLLHHIIECTIKERGDTL